jgi:hypothetical protein
VLMVRDGLEMQYQKSVRSGCEGCVGAENGGLNGENIDHRRAVQGQAVVFLVVASGCCSLSIFPKP